LTPTPVRLVCPACRAELNTISQCLVCAQCGGEYRHENGFPNLIIGARFGDQPNPDRSAYEELSNEHTTRQYLLPAFRALFPDRSRPRRLLSVGCGTGVDVDVLSEAGFDITGVDCGSRCEVWPRRRFPERLLLANGMNLPFEDAAFDLAYCGCVFPHVGTLGDSHRMGPGYREERLELAMEMTRVVQPGGYVLVSSPNRLFPVDLFHGRTNAHPLPRLNPPGSPFLLSAADYRGLFRQAGCNLFRLLPVEGYWGFVNRKSCWTGRILVFPVECLFWLVSREPLRFLRGLPISPWLVLLMRKEAGCRTSGN
jgi:SAM-dependent methyltransferase